MFGISLAKLAIILLVAGIVLGPERLPETARSIGRHVRQLRRAMDAARDEIRRELGPAYADLELEDLDLRRFGRKHLIEALNDSQMTGQPRPTNDRRDGTMPPYDAEAT